MFDKDLANKFVDASVRFSINNSEELKNFFESAYEGAYNGDLISGTSGVSEAFRKVCERSKLFENNIKMCRGSYPLSSIFAETITAKILESRISGGQLQKILDNLEANNGVDENTALLLQNIEECEEEIVEEIDETNDRISAIGYSDDVPDTENIAQVSLDNFLLMKNNSVFKFIADICGRMKNIYTNIKRTTPGTNPELPDTYEFSGDITRIMPEYFAQLDCDECPELEDLFYKDLAEESLVSQKFISKDRHGGGDIRLFVDYSGSMDAPSNLGQPARENTRQSWAYATAAALKYIIYEESKNHKKRRFETTMFAGMCTTKDCSDDTPVEYIKWLLNFGGGYSTDPNSGLFEFCERLKNDDTNNKTDIVLITDGAFNLRDDVRILLEECRKTKNLHIFCIYIGTYPNPTLSAITDIELKIGDVFRFQDAEDSKSEATRKIVELLKSSAEAR